MCAKEIVEALEKGIRKGGGEAVNRRHRSDHIVCTPPLDNFLVQPHHYAAMVRSSRRMVDAVVLCTKASLAKTYTAGSRSRR